MPVVIPAIEAALRTPGLPLQTYEEASPCVVLETHLSWVGGAGECYGVQITRQMTNMGGSDNMPCPMSI